MNLVYFILVFVFNTGILMAVASSICKMKQVLQTTLKTGATAKGKLWEVRERFNASCKSGLTLFGLTCLMGTTWGLAFLGSGYINYPILYLFCILNSTQGQFSGLCLCASDLSILCLICSFVSLVFLIRFLYLPVDLSVSKEAEKEG